MVRGPQKAFPSRFCCAAQFCGDLQNLDGHGDGAPLPRTDCHEIVFTLVSWNNRSNIFGTIVP